MTIFEKFMSPTLRVPRSSCFDAGLRETIESNYTDFNNDVRKIGQSMRSTHKRKGRPPDLVAEDDDKKRREDIVNIIRINPPLYHRRLLRVIMKRHRLMVKSTAERLLDELVKDKRIGRAKFGRREVYYYLPQDFIIDFPKIDDSIVSNLVIIESEIRRLRLEYQDSGLDEKSYFTAWLLRLIFDSLKDCNLITSFQKSMMHSHHFAESRLRKCLRDLVDIIRSDSDAKLVFPLLGLVLPIRKESVDVSKIDLIYYPPQ